MQKVECPRCSLRFKGNAKRAKAPEKGSGWPVSKVVPCPRCGADTPLENA